MHFHLEQKLALVTGSTMGIGKAVAADLAREGAHVIINGRSEEHVAATVRELSETGTVHGIAADLSTTEGADRLVAAANAIGPVDILVNNAAKFKAQPFEKITDEEWFDYYNTNVMSGVRITRAFLPGMLERNWGRVIFVSSEVAIKPMPQMIPYSMTKTAQVSLARGLAELTKGTRVTVNSVLPGPTWTEGMEGFFGNHMDTTVPNVYEAMESDFFKTHGINSLIQRWAKPEEVADLIVFLCSTNASAINGAAQRVEGGIVRSIL